MKAKINGMSEAAVEAEIDRLLSAKPYTLGSERRILELLRRQRRMESAEKAA